MAPKVMRFGAFVECDDVYFAAGSADLDRMLDVIGAPTNAIDRHYLLHQIVEQMNRRRLKRQCTDAELQVYAELHWLELPWLLDEMARHEALSRLARGAEPRPFVVPGVGTPETLAGCYERAGRLADAERVRREWIGLVARPRQ